jgi:hypothetical protein
MLMAMAFLISSPARSAFDTLSSYPASFEDERSVTLLHRLWAGMHLGKRTLDMGPNLIKASDEDWHALQRIEERRLELIGEFDAAIGFWLAVALLQLGNVPQSRRVLQSLHSVIGRPRRRQPAANPEAGWSDIWSDGIDPQPEEYRPSIRFSVPAQFRGQTRRTGARQLSDGAATR